MCVCVSEWRECLCVCLWIGSCFVVASTAATGIHRHTNARNYKSCTCPHGRYAMYLLLHMYSTLSCTRALTCAPCNVLTVAHVQYTVIYSCPYLRTMQCTYAYTYCHTHTLQRHTSWMYLHATQEYLCDEEFKSLLAMNRQDFYNLPKWKQEACKRKANLF